MKIIWIGFDKIWKLQLLEKPTMQEVADNWKADNEGNKIKIIISLQ
jgi:hypothetical protein